jgi:hypothetical protein
MHESEPKRWTRETIWRQGQVLPLLAAQHLELVVAANPSDTCVVVISHDCDLANDDLNVEPNVEVIIGQTVASLDGNFSWGKAPRKLHCSMTRSGQPVAIELVSTSKRLVSKESLALYAPDPTYVLGGKGLAVLRSWLGARYNRAAFPDSFATRIKELKVDQRLAKCLERHGELISFVYFDLDQGNLIERVKGDPYSLTIVLVYQPGDDAERASEAADELADLVEKEVLARIERHAKEIFLKACLAISEDDLPVSRARVMTQWRLEYMTLRADEEQPGPPIL